MQTDAIAVVTTLLALFPGRAPCITPRPCGWGVNVSPGEQIRVM